MDETLGDNLGSGDAANQAGEQRRYEESVDALRHLSHSYSTELLAKKSRLDKVLGSTHWLSVGTYKESLTRAMPAEKMPRRYEVSTGFVMAFEGQRTTSKQIDVLVWDSENYPPIFRDGDFVIIPPEACRAAIEVKGNLTGGELQKGLENLSSLDQFADFARPDSFLFRALFAFESSIKLTCTILDGIHRHYATSALPLEQRIQDAERLGRDDPFWIDAIAVLDQGVVARETWTVNGRNHRAYALLKTVSESETLEQVANDTYGFIERALLAGLITNGSPRLMRFDHPGSHRILLRDTPHYAQGRVALLLPCPDLGSIQSIGTVAPEKLKEWADRIYVPETHRVGPQEASSQEAEPAT